MTMLLAMALSSIQAPCIFGQGYENTPVSVSKEKVRINGKVFLSHIVLERQTLYSISKAYNVSIEDIYRHNPTVREAGLKKNSIILIPSQETIEQIRLDSLAKVNAAAEAEAKTEANPQKQEKKEKKVKRRTHIAKWYEDLELIAQKYGVSADAIRWLNELSEDKLTSRQKLLIPNEGEYEDALSKRNISRKDRQDTVLIAQSSDTAAVINEAAEGEWALFPKSRINATVLLPLKADEENGSRNNLDFYSGILLAVYNLAEEGISTDLSVFDIAKGDLDIPVEALEGSDLIIGPVSTGDISRFLQNNPVSCPVISPLDPRAESLVASNSGLIHAPTPHKAQYEDLTAWIKTEMQPQDTVLVITEKGVRTNEGVRLMLAAIDSSKVAYNNFSYSILEGRDIMEPITALMAKTGTTHVLIASESEAFVNDVVRNLNVMIYNKFNVVLYGSAKIRNFETIEVENFHKGALHVSLAYNIDYSDRKVMDFLMKYRALFKTEPSQYAFQGYDIAEYFIRLCHKYGNRWTEKLEDTERAMLQSTFRYKKSGDGGYVNSGVRRIVYGDKYDVVIQNTQNK